MRAHDELDLLSAYLDGELDAPDRGRVEAHLADCAECRRTLQALRMTVADLATLPEPAPSPQDSWALRAAVRRARRPVRRWERLAWGAGAAAAVLVGVLVVVQGQRSADRDAALTAKEAGRPGGASGPIFETGADYDEQSALARLATFGGEATLPTGTGGAPAEDRSTDTSAPAAAAQPGPPASYDLRASSAETKVADPPPELARCERVVRGSTAEPLEALRFEIARYRGEPAFLMFFQTAGRIELWVMARADCRLLFFAQRSR